MKRYLPILAILLTLSLVFSLTGCMNDEPNEPDPPVVSEPELPVVSEPEPPPPSPSEDSGNEGDSDDGKDSDDDVSTPITEPEILADRVWAFIKGGMIWTRDIQGNEEKLTFDYDEDVWDLFWSPDGSQIAFLRITEDRDYNLWLMDADGGNARQIDDSISYERVNSDVQGYIWSPDGSRLAYYKDQQIIIRETASEDKVVIPVQGGYTDGPWWHPGGKYLAFTGDLSEPGVFVIDTETEDSMLLPNTASPMWREDSLVAASYELGSFFYDSPEDKSYFRNYTGINVYSLSDFSKTLSVSLPQAIREILPVKFMLSSSERYVAFGDATHLWAADLEEGVIAELGQQDIIDTGSEYWIQFYSLWAPGQDLLLSVPFIENEDDNDGILELTVTDMVTGETQVLTNEAFSPLNYVPAPQYIWLTEDNIYKLSHIDYSYSWGKYIYNLQRKGLNDMEVEGTVIERTTLFPRAKPN